MMRLRGRRTAVFVQVPESRSPCRSGVLNEEWINANLKKASPTDCFYANWQKQTKLFLHSLADRANERNRGSRLGWKSRERGIRGQTIGGIFNALRRLRLEQIRYGCGHSSHVSGELCVSKSATARVRGLGHLAAAQQCIGESAQQAEQAQQGSDQDFADQRHFSRLEARIHRAVANYSVFFITHASGRSFRSFGRWGCGLRARNCRLWPDPFRRASPLLWTKSLPAPFVADRWFQSRHRKPACLRGRGR